MIFRDIGQTSNYPVTSVEGCLFKCNVYISRRVVSCSVIAGINASFVVRFGLNGLIAVFERTVSQA